MEPRKWDDRYLSLAELFASWSKDRSTKVGCVIVGSAGQVLATGYNGFPRGVNDDIEERHERPAKYLWTGHAEENGICNAARTGVSVEGSTLYVPFFPCAPCARMIVQSGIAKVVMDVTKNLDPRWFKSNRVGEAMFEEAGVTIRWYEPESQPSLES